MKTEESEGRVVRSRRGAGWWARVILPALIIVAWLGAAGAGGPLFGRIDEVSSNDQNAYLPSESESATVGELARDFYDSEDVPTVVVIVADDGTLDGADMEAIDGLAQTIANLDVTGAVSPPIPSEDGAAVQLFVPIDSSVEVPDGVDTLREAIADDLPGGLTAYVTGPGGLIADLGAAFAGVDGLLLAVAFAAVLIILLIVYRSIFLPLAVLTTSVLALAGAILVVWNLADWGVFLLNGQVQGILFILVIGAATDYSLLYVSRYREELLQNEDVWQATRRAWRGTIEPVLASGGTVIAGLLTLLLSDLESNSVLGPVASVGIIFAILASLTLLPAVLGLVGRRAFWPRVPAYDASADSESQFSYGGIWGRTVRFVERSPRPIWIVTAIALAIGALGVTQLRADGVAETELVLTASEARDGQEVLSERFAAGSGSPATVLVDEGEVSAAVAVLAASDGVDSVTITAADSPSGQAPITPDGIAPVGPPGTPTPEPTVVDGRVLLQATLSDPADDGAALQTIDELRAAMAESAPSTLIGGPSATNLDTITTSIEDRQTIIPIVLIVILVILMALLRAIVAPIILVLTTILSFGTAMGVSAIVFNEILDFPGADPAVPLYAFVFLVALSIDYTIFLMTRVREETVKHGTHRGIVRGLAVTGTVITSAGIVLASTFAALAVIPILFLFQLAFIVAFGVLLDTFIVRTLLVPALSLDIGRRIWWPSRLASTEAPGEVEAEARSEEPVGASM